MLTELTRATGAAFVKTECTQRSFEFHQVGRRRVTARFDGGDITSEGGALLLRQTEQRVRVLRRFAACFTDHRDPLRIEHSVEELVAQRVYGLALGYEDLVDHDDLRRDPLLAAMVGKRDLKGEKRRRRDRGFGLAGRHTLNRLELTREGASSGDRYKKVELDFDAVDRLLVEVFMRAHASPPEEIILDLDATNDPLHGHQEGRFFHGYYDEYCYLPLYIFAGDHLLCARLRRSNIDPAKGSLDEVAGIVAELREAWPGVQIIVRGDSGFCRDEIMTWCEENGLDYVLGLARNRRLEGMLEKTMRKARILQRATGEPTRLFKELNYRTRTSWSKRRRVVGKAEVLTKGTNPRFVVTSISKDEWDARSLYEDLYCARGDMENRIKEQQRFLFADRTSTHWMRSNQIRLYFSSIAYLLVSALRRVGLTGTEMARAQCDTIRTKLFKIGALVRITARRVWVSLSSACPYSAIFAAAYDALGRAPPD